MSSINIDREDINAQWKSFHETISSTLTPSDAAHQLNLLRAAHQKLVARVLLQEKAIAQLEDRLNPRLKRSPAAVSRHDSGSEGSSRISDTESDQSLSTTTGELPDITARMVTAARSTPYSPLPAQLAALSLASPDPDNIRIVDPQETFNETKQVNAHGPIAVQKDSSITDPSMLPFVDPAGANTMPLKINRSDSMSRDLGLPEPVADISLEAIAQLGQTPNAFSDFRLVVRYGMLHKVTSKMRTSRDDPVVVLCASNKDGIQWHIVKDLNQIRSLDSVVRTHNPHIPIPQLPARSLFSSASPVKVDVRIDMLSVFFERILENFHELDSRSSTSIGTFLTTDVVEISPDVVSGFLSSRARFSSWKIRFYVRSGDKLYVLDRPGGSVQQTISLSGAAVQPIYDRLTGNDDEHRHGFTITEHKSQTSRPSVYHLCAESKASLANWLKMLGAPSGLSSNVSPSSLLPYKVIADPNQASMQRSNSRISRSSSVSASLNSGSSSRYAQTLDASSVSAPMPIQATRHRVSSGSSRMVRSSSVDFVYTPPTSPAWNPGTQHGPQPIPVPGLSKGTAILPREQRATQRSPPLPTSANLSIPHRSGSRRIGSPTLVSHGSPSSTVSEDWAKRRSSSNTNKVFGAPLIKTISFSSLIYDGVELPTVVVKCIDRLRSEEALSEQGLFRLSGTQSQVDELEQKFENDEVIDLAFTDLNVVASLLKRYLRCLPQTLTSGSDEQVWRDALGADSLSRTHMLRNATQALPHAQYDLLGAVIGLLSKVYYNREINKMSLRNLSIVFSPTLGIPGHLITVLIQDFESIFAHSPTSLPLNIFDPTVSLS